MFNLDDITEILMYAAAAGAACVQGVGTTTTVTKENVDRLINTQADYVRKRIMVRKNLI